MYIHNSEYIFAVRHNFLLLGGIFNASLKSFFALKTQYQEDHYCHPGNLRPDFKYFCIHIFPLESGQYYTFPSEIPSKQFLGFRFSSHLGAVSIRKTVLPGMAIPMLKIRRPNGRLIFNMGIPIPGKDGLYIETGPWISCSPLCGLIVISLLVVISHIGTIVLLSYVITENCSQMWP